MLRRLLTRLDILFCGVSPCLAGHHLKAYHVGSSMQLSPEPAGSRANVTSLSAFVSVRPDGGGWGSLSPLMIHC